MGSGECEGHRPPGAPVGAGLRARAGGEGVTRTWGNGGRKAVKTTALRELAPRSSVPPVASFYFLGPESGPCALFLGLRKR